ncbi:hypothetical protein RM780_13825 [Streptomyces sp. DSM 44917]|uniref:Uncharacterized protein n=1 Tax=Streptomyces boetiae TaxID=3075541 RepID=A0ABU2L8Z0_9ACTN|nr:hypothetical protein [Streptomyces sp. DSM 44917]MDT0308035.1 hypothetical protein [Streptomyces sp. DSM 44917]
MTDPGRTGDPDEGPQPSPGQVSVRCGGPQGPGAARTAQMRYPALFGPPDLGVQGPACATVLPG